MKVACPTCGADVEFRFDDTLARVCDACGSAVVRTDRGPESLGKIADLAPFESPLALFADGTWQGESFLLIGVAQVRHPKGGLWQEWYAKFGPGKVGWLAEGQGRLYLTFVDDTAGDLPSFDAAVPGSTLALGGAAYTVTERGEGTYTAARGELPYRLEPNATFRFVDLQGEGDRFATIDYADGRPVLYTGRLVTPAELTITGGEAAPRARPKQAATLTCPRCAAPIPLRVPERTQTVTCPACDSILDTSAGALALLGRLQTKPAPRIPLGSHFASREGKLQVVGYVERSAFVDDQWWPFYEYLLFAPDVGYRWLVSSDGHWSYVQPVTAAAITEGPVTYAGATFTAHQSAYLRIDAVYGELYWRAQLGEQVLGEDFVAPPAMLSRETSFSDTGIDEVTWSLASYLTPQEVARACEVPASFPPPTGVAPNQPDRFAGAGYIAATVFALLGALGIGKCASSPNEHVATLALEVAPAGPAPATTDPAAEAPGTVGFTPKFPLSAHANVEVQLRAPGLANNYIYAAVDLVNETTGVVTSADTNLEYYSGYEDGESWSEGDNAGDLVFGDLPAGEYSVRVEAQQGTALPVTLGVEVVEGVWRARYFLWALGAATLVFGFVRWRSARFEARRRETVSLDAVPPAGTRPPRALASGKAWVTHREPGGAPDPDADASSTFGAD